MEINGTCAFRPFLCKIPKPKRIYGNESRTTFFFACRTNNGTNNCSSCFVAVCHLMFAIAVVAHWVTMVLDWCTARNIQIAACASCALLSILSHHKIVKSSICSRLFHCILLISLWCIFASAALALHIGPILCYLYIVGWACEPRGTSSSGRHNLAMLHGMTFVNRGTFIRLSILHHKPSTNDLVKCAFFELAAVTIW